MHKKMKKIGTLIALSIAALAGISCLPSLKGHENPYDPNAIFTAGTTWHNAVASAPFACRYSHGCAVF